MTGRRGSPLRAKRAVAASEGKSCDDAIAWCRPTSLATSSCCLFAVVPVVSDCRAPKAGPSVWSSAGRCMAVCLWAARQHSVLFNLQATTLILMLLVILLHVVQAPNMAAAASGCAVPCVIILATVSSLLCNCHAIAMQLLCSCHATARPIAASKSCASSSGPLLWVIILVESVNRPANAPNSLGSFFERSQTTKNASLAAEHLPGLERSQI